MYSCGVSSLVDDLPILFVSAFLVRIAVI